MGQGLALRPFNLLHRFRWMRRRAHRRRRRLAATRFGGRLRRRVLQIGDEGLLKRCRCPGLDDVFRYVAYEHFAGMHQ